MNDLEVKPCPMCGKEPTVEYFIGNSETGYYVFCAGCKTEQKKTYKTEAGCIKAWNKYNKKELYTFE